jgi:hypothetical protein
MIPVRVIGYVKIFMTTFNRTSHQVLFNGYIQ